MALTVVEMQHLSDFRKSDSNTIFSRQKGQKLFVGEKSVKLKTDRYKLIFVVYRYRNSLSHKNIEVELKLAEYQTLLAKRVYQFSNFDILFKPCNVLNETTVHKKKNLSRMHVIFLMTIFRLYVGLYLSIEHNSVRKTLFLSACHGCILDIIRVRWTEKIASVEPLVMGTPNCSFFSVISKYLDFMILLEQCRPIVAETQDTVT